MYKNRYVKDIFSFNKIINKLVIVLSIVLFVLIVKTIDTKPTNDIVKFIQKNIYYDFSIKEDGKRIGKSIVTFLDNSKDNLEKLTVEIYNNIK